MTGWRRRCWRRPRARACRTPSSPAAPEAPPEVLEPLVVTAPARLAVTPPGSPGHDEPEAGAEFEGTRLFIDDDLPADALEGDRFRAALRAGLPETTSDDAPAAESVDLELVQIFTQEAADLLETLDASLDTWQAGGEPMAAVNEIQRVLHTLKGGARMAGLGVLGDRVHAFESRVGALAFLGHAPDETAFAELRQDAEELHLRNDALQRGDVHERPDFRAAPVGAAALPERADDSPEPASVSLSSMTAPLVLDDGLVDDGPPWAAGLLDPADPLAPAGPETAGESRRELARVRVETLDDLLNQAGEISIHRARLERQQADLDVHLRELGQTISRLREQLRQLDIETEAQILARGGGAVVAGEEGNDRYATEFDPLEMDRYSRVQEITRALAESAGDLGELQDNIARALADGDTPAGPPGPGDRISPASPHRPR